MQIIKAMNTPCIAANQNRSDAINPLPSQGRTKNLEGGRFLLLAAFLFFAVMFAGWCADHSLERVDTVNQEIDAVICEGKQCWGVE